MKHSPTKYKDTNTGADVAVEPLRRMAGHMWEVKLREPLQGTHTVYAPTGAIIYVHEDSLHPRPEPTPPALTK